MFPVSSGSTFWKTFSIAFTSVPTSRRVLSYSPILATIALWSPSRSVFTSVVLCSSLSSLDVIWSFHSLILTRSFCSSCHFSSIICSTIASDSGCVGVFISVRSCGVSGGASIGSMLLFASACASASYICVGWYPCLCNCCIIWLFDSPCDCMLTT